MKIVFFGTPRFAQIVLERLIDSPFKPQLVITQPDKKAGRGQKLQPSPVKQTALTHHIEILQPSVMSNVKGQMSNVDLVVLVAYGKIIPQEILAIPKYGFINVHPSILPKYRGPSPIQTAILDGAQKTGVTIMLLDEKVDHGPILAQKEIAIEKDDTHASLIEKLGNLGADLLVEVLPQYILHLRGEKTLHLEGVLRQDHSKATFTKHISKEDGYIDLANPPDPQTLDRMIRAFHPWPGVWTKLRTQNSGLRTIKFLPGNLILPEGKKPMTVKEFLNGYSQLKPLIEKLRI